MTALANPNVFVFSAASEVARMHYEHTMQNGLKLAQIIGFIDDPSLVYTLRDAYSEGVVYMWAGRTGGHDEGYWEQMAPGDLVLCYRDRRIVSYSYFVAKLKNASLGKLAWPDERIRPFDLIFFLTNPKEVDKPVSELSDYLGEVYQGLRRVAATDKIIRDFGSLEAFVAKGLK